MQRKLIPCGWGLDAPDTVVLGYVSISLTDIEHIAEVSRLRFTRVLVCTHDGNHASLNRLPSRAARPISEISENYSGISIQDSTIDVIRTDTVLTDEWVSQYPIRERLFLRFQRDENHSIRRLANSDWLKNYDPATANRDNTPTTRPCRITNQLCFADLCPTNKHARYRQSSF